MNLFVIGNFDLEAVWKQISSYQVAQMDNPAQSFELAGVQKLPIQEHLSEQFEVSTPKLAVGLRGNDEVDKETIQKYRLSLQFYLPCCLVGLQNDTNSYTSREKLILLSSSN